jgi:hypothetical protein
MNKRIMVLISLTVLLISASIAQADPIESMYGNWQANWSLDNIYWNDGSTTNQYIKQADGTWSNMPDWFYNWLQPDDPKPVTLNIHALDMGNYGGLQGEFSPGGFFDGVFTSLALNGDLFAISVAYPSANTAQIYGNFSNGQFTNVRFDETSTPIRDYVTGQGALTDMSAVPEPSTMILIGSGFIGLLSVRKRLIKK